MADIVNLRRFRKRKDREDAAAQAGQNRIKHGRFKQERVAAELESGREKRNLDGHKRQPEIPAAIPAKSDDR